MLVTLIAWVGGGLLPAWAQPVVFTQLSLPSGIATDADGNVFVHSDAVTTTLLTKFAPNGAALGQLPLGGIDVTEFGGSRLATDPTRNLILLLSPQGRILQIDPATLQSGDFIDLRPFANQVFSDVYDILRQEFRPLQLGFPIYGDIAVGRSNTAQMDVFVTGLTSAAGGFPFIMRLQVDFQVSQFAPRVIATSQGTTAGNVNRPPGIAVNIDDVVLTTLPFPTDGGFVESLVGFHAYFPENPNNPGGFPQFLLNTDLASAGMGTDAQGNFYIATGVVGSSACGAGGSGALVYIPRALTMFFCTTFQATLLRSEDIAISPTDRAVYMTVLDGTVLRLPPVVQ
jgi:hypothetical protein